MAQTIGNKSVDLKARTVTVTATVSAYKGGPSKTFCQIFDYSGVDEATILCKAQQTDTIAAAQRIKKAWAEHSDGDTLRYMVKTGGFRHTVSPQEHIRRGIEAALSLTPSTCTMEHPAVVAAIKAAGL